MLNRQVIGIPLPTVYCFVKKTIVQALTVGGFTQVTFDTPMQNNSIFYDYATNEIVINQPGLYNCHFELQFNHNVVGARFIGVGVALGFYGYVSASGDESILTLPLAMSYDGVFALNPGVRLQAIAFLPAGVGATNANLGTFGVYRIDG